MCTSRFTAFITDTRHTYSEGNISTNVLVKVMIMTMMVNMTTMMTMMMTKIGKKPCDPMQLQENNNNLQFLLHPSPDDDNHLLLVCPKIFLKVWMTAGETHKFKQNRVTNVQYPKIFMVGASFGVPETRFSMNEIN